MTTVRQGTGRAVGTVEPGPVPDERAAAPAPAAPDLVAAPPAVPVPPAPHGRHAVADHRRRLVREQLLVVAVLVAALAVTLTLLALQWLDSGGGTGPASLSAAPVVTLTILTGGNT